MRAHLREVEKRTRELRRAFPDLEPDDLHKEARTQFLLEIGDSEAKGKGEQRQPPAAQATGVRIAASSADEAATEAAADGEGPTDDTRIKVEFQAEHYRGEGLSPQAARERARQDIVDEDQDADEDDLTNPPPRAAERFFDDE